MCLIKAVNKPEIFSGGNTLSLPKLFAIYTYLENLPEQRRSVALLTRCAEVWEVVS